MIGGALLGYLLGSIPFALLLASTYGGRDPRTVGSGNPGAVNVVRTTGVTAGVIVALLDAGKGYGSVWLARALFGEAGAVVAGVAAVVGHVFPVWLRFRGGKGVATACGAFAVLAPLACAAGLAIFVVVSWLTRYASAGSVAAAVALPPLVYVTGGSRLEMAASALTAAVVVARHRQNLVRMARGTERRWSRAVSGRTAGLATGAAPRQPAGRTDRNN